MRIDRKALAEVERLKLVTPAAATGHRQGDRRSPYLGRGVEFADYRPYTPGDDLRLVDWNVYSRLEMLLVRLFHEDRNLAVQICVDASASMAFGEPRKLDHAGALAAALAMIALKVRDSVTLGCAGGTGPRTVIRGQNQNSFAKVLRFLDMVEPDGGEVSVRAIKSQLRGRKPDRLFYISDMLKEPDDTDRLLRVISAAARKPIVLHVLGDEELAPDLRHPKRVTDCETGEELRIAGGRLAEKRYRDALDEYLRDLEARCRSVRIQYVQAFTGLSVAKLLTKVLRRARVTQSASGATR